MGGAFHTIGGREANMVVVGIVSPSWVMFPPKLGMKRRELDPRDCPKHAGQRPAPSWTPGTAPSMQGRNLLPAVRGCDQGWDLLNFSSWPELGEKGHSRWKDVIHTAFLC